jgi:hypothetical protein
MGLFWDLMQQSQISDQRKRAESLEDRVAWLEDEVDRQNELIQRMLQVLENTVGQDIDGDGTVG